MKSFTATKDTIFQDWKKPLFQTKTPKKIKLCANCGKKPTSGMKKYCIPCADYRDTHSGMLPTLYISTGGI